jgi:hypothetical protein
MPSLNSNFGCRFAVLCMLTCTPLVFAASEEPASADKSTELSTAEKILWMSDHLKNLIKGAKLKYEFLKSGSMEEGFKDTVELLVTKVNNDETKNIAIDFFTGDRRLPIEPHANVTGNQVLQVYLDGDLHEMHRLAQGSRPYFQRSLKMAFAEAAKVEDVTIAFAGKSVTAKKVVVMPFVSDPKRSLFEKFANKIYEFTVSDAIPGGLYRIHTLVPDSANPKAGPLLEESLTLTEAK